jgi:cell division transport system permease protein
MLDRLEFIISEAFVALRRNTLMSLAAVTTVAVSLFFLGGLGYAFLKLSEFGESLPKQLDARIHLYDHVRQPQISELAARIREMPGVASVQWIPREKAWEKEREKWGPSLTEGVENPLSDALKVNWADLSKAPETGRLIQALPGVETVVQYGEAQRLIADTLVLLRNVGVGLGGILFLTGGILIYNAIKLTIISRRREIRIMQLVGASRSMITTPFLIEGVIQGILGGVLATLIMWASHKAWENYVQRLPFIYVPEISTRQVLGWLGLLCAAGAAYGFICSSVAVREPTKLK